MVGLQKTNLNTDHTDNTDFHGSNEFNRAVLDL